MKEPNVDPDTLRKLYWDDKLTLGDIGIIYNTSKNTIHEWFKYFDIPRRSNSEAKKEQGQSIPNANPNTLRKLYHEDVLSLAEIGQMYGVTASAIHYWFKYFNIPTRSVNNSHIKGPRIPKVDKEILKKLYWDDELILKDIAIILKCSEFTILNYFQYYNIPCRTRSESTLKRDLEDPDILLRNSESNQDRWDSMSDVDRQDHKERVSAGRQGIPHEDWEDFVSDGWRDTIEYKQWTTAVIKRDNNTCQLCNRKDGIKHRHHIYPVRKYPELKYDVENGVTLCPECHYKTFGYEEEWADIFIGLIN